MSPNNTPDLVTPPTVERFRRWGIVAWAVIGMLILAGVVLWGLMKVHEIFPPLVVALVTIYILNPVVTRLQNQGIPRILGSCLTYLIMIGVVAVAIALLVPVVVDQAQAFARDFPETVDRVNDLAEGVTGGIERRFGTDIDVSEWLGGRSGFFTDMLRRTPGFLRGAATTITLLVIGLVVGFYLLVDLPQLRRAARRLIPPDRRQEASEVAGAVGTAMGGFFRGQLLVALIVGIMSSIGLAIIGLPYWAVVGLIAGFFNLVPLIGPFVGAIPAIVIAAAMRPPITILFVAIVLTVVQQIDNHFISPNIMRWTVRLHPVTVMISLTAGAALAGFFGMLLAVPVVAAGKVIIGHVWRTRVPWGAEVFEEPEDLETVPDEHRSPAELAERGPVREAREGDSPSDRPAVLGDPPA